MNKKQLLVDRSTSVQQRCAKHKPKVRLKSSPI